MSIIKKIATVTLSACVLTLIFTTSYPSFAEEGTTPNGEVTAATDLKLEDAIDLLANDTEEVELGIARDEGLTGEDDSPKTDSKNASDSEKTSKPQDSKNDTPQTPFDRVNDIIKPIEKPTSKLGSGILAGEAGSVIEKSDIERIVAIDGGSISRPIVDTNKNSGLANGKTHSDGTTSVNTGDSSPVFLYVLGAGVAVALLVVLLVLKKKR